MDNGLINELYLAELRVSLSEYVPSDRLLLSCRTNEINLLILQSDKLSHVIIYH